MKHLAPSRDVVKELDVSVPSKEMVGHEEEENVALVGVYLWWGLLSLQGHLSTIRVLPKLIDFLDLD